MLTRSAVAGTTMNRSAMAPVNQSNPTAIADSEKARLAEEISRVERELARRKQLEDEIRQMEAAIAAAASGQPRQLQHSAPGKQTAFSKHQTQTSPQAAKTSQQPLQRLPPQRPPPPPPTASSSSARQSLQRPPPQRTVSNNSQHSQGSLRSFGSSQPWRQQQQHQHQQQQQHQNQHQHQQQQQQQQHPPPPPPPPPPAAPSNRQSFERPPPPRRTYSNSSDGSFRSISSLSQSSARQWPPPRSPGPGVYTPPPPPPPHSRPPMTVSHVPQPLQSNPSRRLSSGSSQHSRGSLNSHSSQRSEASLLRQQQLEAEIRAMEAAIASATRQKQQQQQQQQQKTQQQQQQPQRQQSWQQRQQAQAPQTQQQPQRQPSWKQRQEAQAPQTRQPWQQQQQQQQQQQHQQQQQQQRTQPNVQQPPRQPSWKRGQQSQEQSQSQAQRKEQHLAPEPRAPPVRINSAYRQPGHTDSPQVHYVKSHQAFPDSDDEFMADVEDESTDEEEIVSEEEVEVEEEEEAVATLPRSSIHTQASSASRDSQRQQLEEEIRQMEAAIAKATAAKKRPTTTNADAVDSPNAPSAQSNSFLASIQAAAVEREERLLISSDEVVAEGARSEAVPVTPSPPRPTATEAEDDDDDDHPPARPCPGLFLASIKAAAADREQRLEETGGELIMQDIEPEVEEEVRSTPQLSFDMAELITKKARDREERLASGGEKKMTVVKDREEYKAAFSNICMEAAELGRLTRLDEHTVEAISREKRPEEEWKSQGLLAIQWKSSHMSVIHEAAALGNQCKLPENVVSNFCEDEEEWERYYTDEYDETAMSPRMAQLLELSDKAGTGQHKVDKLVLGLREEKEELNENLLVKPMYCYYANIGEVKLPKTRPPKVDPTKAKERLQQKLQQADLEDRPLTDISAMAAEIAWERRTRLDRPGNFPRVKEKCECPYCVSPSPYQTFAYRELERRIKEQGYDSEEEARKLAELEEQKLAEEKARERQRMEELEAQKRRQASSNIMKMSRRMSANAAASGFLSAGGTKGVVRPPPAVPEEDEQDEQDEQRPPDARCGKRKKPTRAPPARKTKAAAVESFTSNDDDNKRKTKQQSPTSAQVPAPGTEAACCACAIL